MTKIIEIERPRECPYRKHQWQWRYKCNILTVGYKEEDIKYCDSPDTFPDTCPLKTGTDDKYNELLMEVASKFPGESRHETARRYIREAENVSHGEAVILVRERDKKEKEE